MTSDNISKGVNAHIREYLDYYCHLSNPKFAVLLKGPWGSGKTWLIREFMKQFNAQINDQQNQPSGIFKYFNPRKHLDTDQFIYISLYEIQRIEEIEYEFIRQLLPIGKSLNFALVGKLLGATIQSFFKAKIDLNAKDIPQFLKNAKNKILILDDLERCQVEISHILGYINRSIEQESFKVILLANEEKLGEFSEYFSSKEKVIGQTLEIECDFQGAFNFLVSELCQKNEIKDTLKNFSQGIQRIYESSEYKNIRTLRKIILDFNKIWNNLPSIVIKNESAIREIINLLVIFSIEVSRGNIRPEDLYFIHYEYQKLCKKVSDPSTPESENKSIKHYIIFLREYLSSGYNLFPIDRWWGEFFDKGIINEKLLKQSIQDNPYFRDENTALWLKFYEYDTLTDEKFFKALADIENQFFLKKIDDPKVVFHIFGTLLELSANGLSKKSLSALESIMKSYVQQWREAGSFLDFSQALLKQHDQSLELSRLKIRGQNHNSFKVILSYIFEYYQHDQTIALQHEAKYLLQVMKNSPYEFQAMINTFIDKNNNYRLAKYQSIAIFQLIDIQDFVEAFLSLEPRQQSLIVYAIIKRHELDRGHKALTDEHEWIRNMIESLRVEMFNRKKIPLPSGFVLADHILNLEGKLSQFIDMNPEKFD